MKTFREFLDLTEYGIERVPSSDYPGGKKALGAADTPQSLSNIRPLPSHAGYGYTISTISSETLICRLYDFQPEKHGYQDTTHRYTDTERAQKDFTPSIGKLSVNKISTLRVNSAPLTLYQISSVTVDEQPVYRNKGLGLAMYLLLLRLPHVALVADAGQTPHGRKMWVKLAAHPEVQVDGMIRISDTDFEHDRHEKDGRTSLADTLFGTLGVDYLGVGKYNEPYTRFPSLDYRFFTFPVMSSELTNPAKKIKELMAVQKHPWTEIYRRKNLIDVSLIARLKNAL